jgi:hypothetical protein
LVNTPRFQLHGFVTYANIQPNSTNGEDTYIRENAETNYGDVNIMRAGKTVANIEFRGLIKFNLSEIPESNTILNATIQVYAENSYGSGNRTMNIYRITENWVESEATWAKRTATDYWFGQGGEYDSSATIDSVVFTNESGRYYNFSITSLLRNWMNETYDNYGIIIITTGTYGNYTEISSSDSSTAGYRPLLIVEHDSNTVPTITNVSSTATPTNLSKVGETVNFIVYWGDLENNPTKLFVCNSSYITSSGCGGLTYCNVSYSTSPSHNCSYTVKENDTRTMPYSVAVCEAGQCSGVQNDSFYINHLPTVTEVVQPNGGETINQSAGGNYQIKFSMIDSDSDNLTASLYYSSLQNVKENFIASINLNSTYCNNVDSNTSTPQNNCWYWWNSTGIYGEYYLTIDLNDSYHNQTNSSSSTFNVISLIDPSPPELYNVSIDSPIYSGQMVSVNATISDDNSITAWVAFNQTIENATMSNVYSDIFTGLFEASQVGMYQYKVFAKDIVQNLNDSIEWTTFEVQKPSATIQNESYPQVALPFHVIKISGSINATNNLKNISAYLNIPEGFTFLSDYPQMSIIGDMERETTEEVIWYLSTPLSEGAYTLNITFSDKYFNYWNSSNMQMTITSAIGGYELSVDGYPEVETSNTYYVESSFKQSGIYSNPDSMFLELYDSSGGKVVGPVEMSQKSTGIYNYSYQVGASATEGQWRTLVNATKDETSYYAQEFWKVVGGPFDIRNVTIIDDIVPDLSISFIAENTGGANKDLMLIWNLTRTDTGEILDTGGDTRMVPASSELVWDISPSTDYVGQTSIVIIGYYSGTEKAGAYKVFSTKISGEVPPVDDGGGGGGGGGGGDGGAPIVPLKIAKIEIRADEIIAITNNIPKRTKVYVDNTGEKDITNISLTIEGINKDYYSISPIKIKELLQGKSAFFEVTYLILEPIENETNIKYLITSNEIDAEKDAKLIVLSIKDYFEQEIQGLKKRVEDLKMDILNVGEKKILDSLKICEASLKTLEDSFNQGDFYKVADDIPNTENCLDEIESKLNEEEKLITTRIIIGIIILICIILITYAVFTYMVYRKFKIITFLKKQQEANKPYVAEGEDVSEERIEKKFKRIEKKLGIRGSKKTNE